MWTVSSHSSPFYSMRLIGHHIIFSKNKGIFYKGLKLRHYRIDGYDGTMPAMDSFKRYINAMAFHRASIWTGTQRINPRPSRASSMSCLCLSNYAL